MYEALYFQIEQACDPQLSQSHLERCLEICDLVNQKQKGYPRETAFHVVKLINGRVPQVALNALSLLDILVKNCGYPMQLIIATKEFLNELVKRFPEKPAGGNLVIMRILELIQQWNSTICVTSRYRDDFKHITDMYRLLSYKGYHFPGVSGDAAAVLTVPESLKTEEELEDEDRVAQGAKLQELLRLGTPAALEQANDLMKVMAGYDLKSRPDYKQQVNDELDKILSKIELLNGLMQEKTLQPQTTFNDLVGSLKSAQLRIQKLIEGGEDEDRMERLLELNDYINTALSSYASFRAGKTVEPIVIERRPSKTPQNPVASSSTSPVAPSSSSSQPVASPAVGAISLIDFDDSTIPESSPYAAGNYRNPAASIPQPPAAKPQTAPTSSLIDDIAGLDFFGGGGGGGGGLSSVGSSAVGAPPSLGSSLLTPSVVAPLTPAPVPSSAILSSAATVPVLAPSPTASSPPVSSSNTGFGAGGDLFELLGSPAPSSNAQPAEVFILNKNGLQIKLGVTTIPGQQRGWKGQLTFLNTTPVVFTDLAFQLAVPKTMTLNMLPLSGTVVPALNVGQVFQSISVVSSNPAAELRLRFKVMYKVNGAQVEEVGEFVQK
ncbi:VHS domain-containing protein [Zopfochytrium polystomum]|nr:VHS domain-containing protein [Zopfochytrium polystomum]